MKKLVIFKNYLLVRLYPFIPLWPHLNLVRQSLHFFGPEFIDIRLCKLLIVFAIHRS
jgi:hypothetical protein